MHAEEPPDYTDDPRDSEVSDQLPEEQPGGASEGTDPAQKNGRTPEAPEQESGDG